MYSIAGTYYTSRYMLYKQVHAIQAGTYTSRQCIQAGTCYTSRYMLYKQVHAIQAGTYTSRYMLYKQVHAIQAGTCYTSRHIYKQVHAIQAGTCYTSRYILYKQAPVHKSSIHNFSDKIFVLQIYTGEWKQSLKKTWY